MEVKAFRRNKWRSAVIRKIHSDGSFKVIYKKDNSSESHVSVERIGLTPETIKSIEVFLSNKKYATSDSRDKSKAGNEGLDWRDPSAYPNPKDINSKAFLDIDANNADDEFVVVASESLDDWIESSDIPPDEYAIVKDSQESKAYSVLHQPNSVHEFRVQFPIPPLGFTLARGDSGSAEVVRVKLDGQANSLGVMVGDLLVGVNSRRVVGYDDAMSLIGTGEYPIVLTIQRGVLHRILHTTSDAVIKGSKLILDSVGLNKRSILQEPSNHRLSNRANDKKSSESSDSNFLAVGNPFLIPKRSLSLLPLASDEFDVIFEDGDLGIRLEEVVGYAGQRNSVVTNLTDKSQAINKGVEVAAYVVGINGEPFISHAHTIASLKHSKRPIKVRFKKPK